MKGARSIVSRFLFQPLLVCVMVVLAGILSPKLAESAELTIYASEDATLYQLGGNMDANNGDDQSLAIAGVVSYGGDADSILRFDLSKIPRGSTIASAKLFLNRNGNVTDGDVNTGIQAVFTQSPLTPPWDENSVTWNNAPARGPSLFTIAITPITADQRTIEHSSEALLDWINSARTDPAVAKAGWRVKGLSNGNQGVSLCSREFAFGFFAPRLVITYDGVGQTNRLQLSNLIVAKKGNPFCEEANGMIGASCIAGDAIDLYMPQAISGDFTAICRFSAFLPKVWINVPQASVGMFLRSRAIDGSVCPDVSKIVCSSLSAAWADSGNYYPGAKAGSVSGSVSIAYLQQKQQYEFYFRIVNRDNIYAVSFSRNGMNWMKLAEAAVSEYTTSYCGVGISVPVGGARSSIVLKGFEIFRP